MDRIMKALESLLAEKPFERITMAELAQESGTGVSSIYARFSDKHALIIGMHGRVRDEVIECLEALTAPARWEGKTVEEIVRGAMPAIILFYRRHEPLLRAALFIDTEVVRDRQANVLRLVSEKFSALFSARNPRAAKATARAVDASVRIVASVMYATIIFGNVQMVRVAASDRELARQLSTAVIALLNDALNRDGR